MNLVRGALAVAALLAASLHAQAETWEFVDAAKNGDRYFIDRDSLRLADFGATEVWVKRLPKKAERLNPKSKNSPTFTEQISLFEFFCGRRKQIGRQFLYRNAAGDTVDSSNDGTGQAAIVPGSMGEAIYEVVCPTQ